MLFEAIDYFRKAITLNPDYSGAYFNLGRSLQNAGQVDEAMLNYQKAIQIAPESVQVYNSLGILLHDKGQIEEAITCFQKAIQINPHCADSYNNIGLCLNEKGNLDEAMACYQKAINLNPNFHLAYDNLGNIMRTRGCLDEAAECYSMALKLQPNSVHIYNNLGMTLQDKGQLDEAITNFKKAINLDPDFADAYNNLGVAFRHKGQLDDAIACFQKAVNLNPNFHLAYDNWGIILSERGQLNEGEIYLRRALQIKPDSSDTYSNLLLGMNYNPSHSPQDILSAHLLFAKKFAEPLASTISPYINDRAPSRKLKIGYISPDFRRHSVNYFIEPVLASHDHDQFETFCYSDVLTPDNVTKRLQNYADQWRNITGITDEKVVELIRKDGIDILVDLAGHTGFNRMMLFARKPAPIQISWLGYPNTTGLSTIDYRIVDYHTDPPGLTDPFYTEKLIRMPESFLCYLPDKNSPNVGELSALKNGYVTFGSFNIFQKVSHETIELWASILKALPNSRLILKAKTFFDKITCNYVKEKFRAHGVSDDRVELIAMMPSFIEHLNSYQRVDVALDTFPYNGTTTTCEAMWMGVPVMTLAGNTHASRVGISLLSNVGLSELIAKTPNEYIVLTTNLSKDIDKLLFLRKNIRDMMAKSPLCDANRFTINLENCYRQIWRNWCASGQTAVHV